MPDPGKPAPLNRFRTVPPHGRSDALRVLQRSCDN